MTRADEAQLARHEAAHRAKRREVLDAEGRKVGTVTRDTDGTITLDLSALPLGALFTKRE